MQKKTTLIAAAATALTVTFAVGCGGSSKTSTGGVPGAQKTHSTTLVGAGSTLVAPLVGQWQGPYSAAHGVTVAYSAIGSGGGIQQLTARTVDFGASDAPLSADQAKACRGCVQAPWGLAATTVSYNVPGLSQPLRLSGPVIADMYLGTIKDWNDPRASTSTRVPGSPRRPSALSTAATRAVTPTPSPTSFHTSARCGSRRSASRPT